MRRRSALLALALLAATVPARADMFQDASNAKLPWNLATTNDVNLNNGIHIITGYTGPLDNSVQTRWWGVQVQYGADDCQEHMYHLFRYLRGFSYGLGSCGTQAPGSTVTQFIPGLFSVVSKSPNGGIPLIGQAMIGADGVAVWGINTVTADTNITGHSAQSGSGISGTTMTISSVLKGGFNVGDLISGTGVVPNSYILAQLSGTPGGAGTYQLNYPSTVSNQRMSAKPYFFGGLGQDEFDRFCDLNDTRCRNIIDGSFPNGDQASVYGATLGGTVTAGDTVSITITDGMVAGSPRVVSATAAAGDTPTTLAVKLAAAIHADINLQAINYFARPVGNVLRIYYPTNNGPMLRPTASFASAVTGAATETVSLALLSSGNNQRFGLGTTTFAGSVGKWQNSFQSGDGSADFAMLVGTSKPTASLLGGRSQSIKWHYTDNTTVDVVRLATMYVDPTLSGATGTDFVLDNNSGQVTNLRLSNGGLTMSGNLVTDTPTGNTHIMRTTVGNANDTELWFQKARGGNAGPTIISANDNLGSIRFQGYDGSAYVNGASIIGTSQSVAAGNVGGILQLLTNGTERLRLTDTMTMFGPPAGATGIKPSAFTRLQVRRTDDTDFGFLQAKLQTETNYTAGIKTATGFLTLYDAAGTAYRVNACLASACP